MCVNAGEGSPVRADLDSTLRTGGLRVSSNLWAEICKLLEKEAIAVANRNASYPECFLSQLNETDIQSQGVHLLGTLQDGRCC